MDIPELVSKHLKLLSQKPHTTMTLQLEREEKQAPGVLTLWSSGSPNLNRRPEANAHTHNDNLSDWGK